MFMGTLGLIATRALVVAVVVSLIVHITAMITGQARVRRLSRISMMIQFGIALVAAICLIYLLVTENFWYAYVAEYTSQGLPLLYRIAAFWGGNAGSLLLWVVVLTLYGLFVSVSKHDDSERMLPIAGLIMTATALFYTIVLNTEANPFVRLAHPATPSGLNPLLQNPGMTVHPVNIYLGYIGFTVPFAYAMATLILNKTDATWLKVTRRWTLVSWLFLSIGIVYGAHWSYEELGWGGYWAWDPVENASLLPWLTSTAFLHSAVVQEKRGMLKGWNILLVTLTFLLTLLGTFLTRSGVLWSIHAFANAPLGHQFFVFLCITFVVALVIIAWRWKSLKPDRQFEAVVSKESGFMLNNVLFLGSMFAVLWGTVFPIISQGLLGHQMMVSGPFYNSVNLPLGVAIMVLMGSGPVIAWRRSSVKNILQTLIYPFIISVVIGLIAAEILKYTYQRTSTLATAALIAATFVLLTVVLEFVRGVHARIQLTQEPWTISLYRLVAKNRRRYGGYVVHVAIALMAVGIAGSGSYHVDVQQQMSVGQVAQVADYQVEFTGMGTEKTAQGSNLYGNLVVRRGGKTLGILQPSASFYNNGQEPSTNVALYSKPLGDLYVVMLGTAGQGQAVFDMHVNPLVSFIWFGGYLFIIGTLVSLWPDRFRRPTEAEVVGDVLSTSQLYQDLAELEYDYRMGKLEAADYESAKQVLSGQLSVVERRRMEIRSKLQSEAETILSSRQLAEQKEVDS